MNTWDSLDSWSNYSSRPSSNPEDYLYQHWQYWRKRESPHDLIERFRNLFLDVTNYPDESIANALLDLVNQETADREFKYVLNRCFYTLINLWYTQPQNHWAISELLEIFNDLPVVQISDPKARQVYRLVQNFAQTDQYAALLRLQQIMNPQQEATLSDVNLSNEAGIGEQKLASRIPYYPFLYSNSLLTKDSGQEQKQNIYDLRRRAEANLGIRLVRYHTQQRVPGKTVTNPTLLDGAGLNEALSFYTGRSEGHTHRDQARWFATYSKTVRSFRDFKDEFVDYLIQPIAAAEPKYSGNHFTRNLRQYLRETLSEFDNQPLNSFILVETCRRLLNFLVVDSPQRPVFRNFRNLVNDVGHALTMGLLLRLVLFCSAVKPWLERCFSVLFNVHERRLCKEVLWLVTSLEHMNVALITNFSDVGYDFSSKTLSRDNQFQDNTISLMDSVYDLEHESLKASRLSYRLSIEIADNETIKVGQDFNLKFLLADGQHQRGKHDLDFDIKHDNVEGNEVNILIESNGFLIQNNSSVSFPVDTLDKDRQRRIISNQSHSNNSLVKLTALRPGMSTVTAEVYVGESFQGSLSREIEVSDIDRNPVSTTVSYASPRPVPYPEYTLKIFSVLSPDGKNVEFNFDLRIAATLRGLNASTNFGGSYQKQVSAVLYSKFAKILGYKCQGHSYRDCADSSNIHCKMIGSLFFKYFLPCDLQEDLSNIIRLFDYSNILIIADQKSWLPWELMYDGKSFLCEKITIGRWPLEQHNQCPYEFPLGAINLVNYSSVASPEHWLDLIHARGSAFPKFKLYGILDDFEDAEALRGVHLMLSSIQHNYSVGDRYDAPTLLGEVPLAGNVDEQMRPRKLNLRRNRPVVSLGYLQNGQKEMTNLETAWAPAFLKAGCSAFVGSLWSVIPEVEAAFISNFYTNLWAGKNLGSAFQQAKQMARTAVPESYDWLSYVLYGDPMARPYRPVEGKGYAVVEPIGQDIQDSLPPNQSLRFRLTLRRDPPVWHEDRLIEVAEDLTFDNLQVHIVALGLEVNPTTIDMSRTPNGNYLGWFTLSAPPTMAGETVPVQVHFADGTEPVHSVTFALHIAAGESE